MGNAQKALVMAAGIFLAIALITIAVVMFISAQEATKTAQDNFSGIQNELSGTAFNVYDNTLVSGSQVINAIHKYDNRPEFGIWVVTGKDANGAWYGDLISTSVNDFGEVLVRPQDADKDKITSVSGVGNIYFAKPTKADELDEAQYINPSGRFQAQVIHDNSNVVKGLTFKQQD